MRVVPETGGEIEQDARRLSGLTLNDDLLRRGGNRRVLVIAEMIAPLVVRLRERGKRRRIAEESALSEITRHEFCRRRELRQRPLVTRRACFLVILHEEMPIRRIHERHMVQRSTAVTFALLQAVRRGQSFAFRFDDRQRDRLAAFDQRAA